MLENSTAFHNSQLTTAEFESLKQYTSPEHVRAVVMPLIQRAVKLFADRKQNTGHEMRICILITEPEDAPHTFHALLHTCELPPIPEPPISVCLSKTHRVNAGAKDSQWVRDAADMEAKKPISANEVVMIGDHGNVLEGISSNVFVIADDTVFTAKDGVLQGTIRTSVMHVCKANDIKVIESPAPIDTLGKWQGMLICSTSRMALPVDKIIKWESDSCLGHTATFDNKTDSSLAVRIARLVKRRISSESEPIDQQQ
jgi:branched-subunit amino acid aminotransferase/4-amino-4-deoxychorismate lyase